jgi:hypothetical protein
MKFPIWLRLYFTRFIAALYLVGAISALLCMLATRYADLVARACE